MSATTETLALLTRIAVAVEALAGQIRTDPPVSLDGPHGDPVVKAKDPRDWAGEIQAGKRLSECPPAYLDLLADRYDFFARKNADDGDERKAGYARTDAARCRGWAARLRAGWTAPAAPVEDFAAQTPADW